MMINQLSTNGYSISEVFDPVLLEQLDNLPVVETRYSDKSYREVLAVRDVVKQEIVSKIIDTAQQVTIEPIRITAVEVWNDYSGYYLSPHKDDPKAQNIMIVYLGSSDAKIGTMFYDDRKSYVVPYQLNAGLILLNSDNVIHGMAGPVMEVECRRAVYINWVTETRHKELYGQA